MKLRTFPTGPYAANAYLLVAGDASSAALVDPGADAPRLLAAIADAGAPLAYVLLTHAHPDHASALGAILDAHPAAKVVLHPLDAAWISNPKNTIAPDYPTPAPVPPARLLALPPDGASFDVLPSVPCTPIHCPGHTPGGLAYLLPTENLLITGDTLFRDSVGRTDLPGGDPHELIASLRRLAALDPVLAVLPGHGDPTTLQRELDCNFFLQRI